ncbi:MAG: peptidogalycan biosysnthesis protein, partial [Methylophilaceae bacterium]
MTFSNKASSDKTGVDKSTTDQISDQVIVQVVGSIANIAAEKWDTLTAGMPLLSHAFLTALEQSGSVGQGTGWRSCMISITKQDKLLGAMPLYIKSNSYGEYVFDWAWADAYEQNGLSYYPKLLSAIPFSPVTSARLLSESNDIKLLLIEALEAVMQQ